MSAFRNVEPIDPRRLAALANSQRRARLRRSGAMGGAGDSTSPLPGTGMRLMGGDGDVFWRPSTAEMSIEPGQDFVFACWEYAIDFTHNTEGASINFFDRSQQVASQSTSGTRGWTLLHSDSAQSYSVNINNGQDDNLANVGLAEVIEQYRYYFILWYFDASEGVDGTGHLVVRNMYGDRWTASVALSGPILNVSAADIVIGGANNTGSNNLSGAIGKVAFAKPSDVASIIDAVEAKLWNNGAGASLADISEADRTAWNLKAYYDTDEESGDLIDGLGNFDLTAVGKPGSVQFRPTPIASETLLFTASGTEDWLGRLWVGVTDSRWVLVHRQAEEHNSTFGSGVLAFHVTEDQAASWKTVNTLDGSTVVGPITPNAGVSADRITEHVTMGFDGGDIVTITKENTPNGTRNFRWRFPAGQNTLISEGEVQFKGTAGQDTSASLGFGQTVVDGAWYVTFSDPNDGFKTMLNRSSDKGVTWEFVSEIHGGPSVTDLNNETDIEKVGDSTWLAVARTENDNATTMLRSTDDASTWSRVGEIGNVRRPPAWPRFNGVDESFNMTSNADVEFGDNDFWFSCRCRMSDKSTGRGLLSLWDTVGDNRSWRLFYGASADLVRAQVSADGVTWTTLDADGLGSPPLGEPLFFLCWYDSASDTLNLRVNDGPTNSTSHSGGAFVPGAIDFLVGDSGSAEFWEGEIGEVVVGKPTTPIGDLIDEIHTFLFNGHAGNINGDNMEQWGVSQGWVLDERAAPMASILRFNTTLTGAPGFTQARGRNAFGDPGVGSLAQPRLRKIGDRLFVFGRDAHKVNDYNDVVIAHTDDPNSTNPVWTLANTLNKVASSVGLNDMGYLDVVPAGGVLRVYAYWGTFQAADIYEYTIEGVL